MQHTWMSSKPLAVCTSALNNYYWLFFLQILIPYLLFVHILFDQTAISFSLHSSESPVDTILIIFDQFVLRVCTRCQSSSHLGMPFENKDSVQILKWCTLLYRFAHFFCFLIYSTDISTTIRLYQILTKMDLELLRLVEINS